MNVNKQLFFRTKHIACNYSSLCTNYITHLHLLNIISNRILQAQDDDMNSSKY